MWTYIYFSIYLDTIDISDHNAIEKYVYEMVRSRPVIIVSATVHNVLTTFLHRLVKAQSSSFLCFRHSVLRLRKIKRHCS